VILRFLVKTAFMRTHFIRSWRVGNLARVKTLKSFILLPGYQKAGNSEEANQMIRKAHLLVDQGGWYMGNFLCLPLCSLLSLSLSLCFFIRLPGWLGMLWIHIEFKSSSFDREHYITELTCYVFFHPSFPAATEFENTISSRFQDDFAEWKFSSSSEQ